jgi:cell division protein FtsI/penicillin-binding protein 2
MNSTRSRIGLLAVVFGAALLVVTTHLWLLMVGDHAVWAARSHENRWAFRSVPSMRGALRDRTGRLLAYDEPGIELSLYYLRFRLRHPVGAAVHGATLWAAEQEHGIGTTYSYSEGVLGPRAAARDLLALPVEFVRPGRLPKHLAASLAFSAVTVLSACSGQPRKRVYAALRQAAQRQGSMPLGDVLGEPSRDALLAAYDALVDSLQGLDAELQREQRTLPEGGGERAVPVLSEQLERLRRASLAGERTVRTRPDGQREPGDLLETIARPFADRVSFELAARLRTGGLHHPGLEVSPSVHRVRCEPVGTALRALLGNVSDLDRAQPDEAWLSRYVARELPPDWLDDMVPAAAVGDAERERFQDEARRSYERELLLAERRGVSGVESAFDGDLMGRLGMRLVEHDARRREHVLWSHLQVEAGADVTLSFDLPLQRLAEDVVRRQHAAMAALHPEPRDRALVEAALAVIDARSGDVLAFAGAPVPGASPMHVPGVFWHGNGSLGSVVKPFVLVEQLQAEAAGRAHRPTGELQPCTGSYRVGHRSVRCSHAHGDDGTDPVQALGESCNAFFFQSVEGLGAEGLARGLRRFGLLPPAGPEDPFAACWQGSVRGLWVAAPRMYTREALLMRAIGYGVEASPLSVARAYAALATGRLPTLGLLPGERRATVPLGDVEAELEVVRSGLRACIETGTARGLTALADFQVHGKTGTAEIGKQDQNNAWFAGYLPFTGRDGVQLCFCGVVYWVRDKVHGGDAAGQLVADLLTRMQDDAELHGRYLLPGGGR